MADLCLQQLGSRNSIRQCMMLTIMRQIIAQAAIPQPDGFRLKASQTFNSANDSTSIQHRFLLHCIDYWKTDPLSQSSFNRRIKKLPFNIAVMNHDNLTGNLIQHLIQYLIKIRCII